MVTVNPEKLPAHALWVELSTRITTQRLHFRSGNEETAARSIYSLFARTRDLMEKNPDATHFQKIAERMLNTTIRPYTARWHGWMLPDPTLRDKDGQPLSIFRDPQVRRTFREELRNLQPFLLGYQKAFDLLRQGLKKDDGKVTVDQWIAPDEALQEKLREACLNNEPLVNLGKPLAAGILPQVWLDNEHGGVPPETIDSSERAFINDRRRLLGEKTAGSEQPIENAIGLALSGGGIKSATFCLGVVQELVRRGIFDQVDYLSTVSGGGYLGAFISAFIGSQPDGAAQQTRDGMQKRVKDTFCEQENGSEARAVRHLRNHSQYLLNGGLFGKLNIGSLLVSGVLANLLMILPAPIFLALALYGLERWGFWNPWAIFPFLPLTTSGLILACNALVLAVVWFLLAMVQRFTAESLPDSLPSKIRSCWEGATILLAVLLMAVGALHIFPDIAHGYLWLRDSGFKSLKEFKPSQEVVATMGVILPILLAVGGYLYKSRGVQKILVKAFILSGPLFYLFVLLWVSTSVGFGAANGTGPWPWQVVAVIAALWSVWSVWLININTFGPHRYYRARLCECYLVLPTTPKLSWWGKLRASLWEGHVPDEKTDSKLGSVLSLPLTTLGESKAAPYHLINTIVNLPASKNRNLRGRNGDFFLLSREFCGSPATGYVATDILEKADPRLDLGSAMAISAAAANSNMGWRTLTNLQFLMTLLNVRLGYWIPNFRTNKIVSQPITGPIKNSNVGSAYLLAEMGGRIQENMGHLNLSDGGHIENLGVYELLRRKCKFIISVDGGANRDLVGGDLQRLERYASIDFSIKFEYDQTELQPDTEGICKASAILVKIIYSKDEIGWMVYLRPGISGVEPNYLLDHWKQHPIFPYESIIDQIFEEEQFEGYRSLGEYAVQSLFQDEEVEKKEIENKDAPAPSITVEKWMETLAMYLLPDNNTVFSNKPAAIPPLPPRPKRSTPPAPAVSQPTRPIRKGGKLPTSPAARKRPTNPR